MAKQSAVQLYYNQLSGDGGPFLKNCREYFTHATGGGLKSGLELSLKEFGDVLNKAFLRKDDAQTVMRFLRENARTIGTNKLEIDPMEKDGIPYAWLTGKYENTSTGIELSFFDNPSEVTGNIRVDSDEIYFKREDFKGTEEFKALEGAIAKLSNSWKFNPEMLLKCFTGRDENHILYVVQIEVPCMEPRGMVDGGSGKPYTELHNLVNTTDAVRQAVEAVQRAYLGTERLKDVKITRIKNLGEKLTRLKSDESDKT